MRLAVSCIPYDGGRSGISVYVRETVRALADAGHSLTLICESGVDPAGIAGGRALVGALHAPRWTRRPVFSMLWHLFFLPFVLRRHRGDLDGLVVCAANRRVLAWYPLPTVATVHDLANFHVPGKYSPMRMVYLARVLPFFARRAQCLVAVSRSTKEDMVRFWHCREESVSVLYNGLPPGTPAPTRHGDAILYISRIEHPGKNHVRLIEAYGRLPPETAADHPLVLAGADWKDAEAVHAAAAASPNAAHVRFTGFVEESSMEGLWAQAGWYVFPSRFVGVGLSLCEAFARGIPAACSANGSLGEIAGDAAVTFDPLSVDSIVAALERLLGETLEEREARIARGRARAAAFSWADHAAGIAALISEMRGGEARLFGIPVAKVTESEAVERVVALAKRPRGGGAARVATLNVDFVANAVRGWPFGGDDELWGYLKTADLTVADGMPLVILSRLLRNPLPCRVTGADMTPAIFGRLAEEGLSAYILGGEEGSLAKALEILHGRFPGLAVCGTDTSLVRLDVPQPEIVERINAARPDVLFVALGNPKQELWMGRNAASLDVPVAIGVGGSFNFIAGRVKRAPRWMQVAGMEWIYRIIQEPGRLWRRYAYGLVKFSWLSFLALLGKYGR